MVWVVVPVDENWVEFRESRNVGAVGRLLANVFKEEEGKLVRNLEAAGREEGKALGQVVKGLVAREA